MKVNKKIINLIIISIYITTLFLGVSMIYGYDFQSETIQSIRRSIVVILPFITILSILIYNKKNLKVILNHKLQLIIYILTIIWVTLTFFFGIHTGIEAFKGLVHYIVLLTYIFILFNLDLSKEEKDKIKKHLFISFIIVMVLGIIQYFFEINLNVYNNEKYPGILGRINSTFFIATLLDKYVVLMFPLITYEMLNNKDDFKYKIILVLATLGCTFTFSRSGQFIFLMISFIFFIVTIFNKQFKNTITIVICVLIMILTPGAKYSIQSSLDYAYDEVHMPKVLQIDLIKLLKFNETGVQIRHVEAGKCADNDCVGDLEGSKFFRDYYKSVGMQLLKEHPIFGVGVGNNYYLYRYQNARDYLIKKDVVKDEYKYMYPHSGYVQLAEEVGYFGFILINGFLLSLAISKLKNLENKKQIYLILVIMIAYLMGNITEGLFHSKQYIYIFAIIYTLSCNYKIKNKNDS